MFSKEEIQKIIKNPHESLAIELKDWLNPDIPSDKAKIIKAAIAMRNNDGGLLIIGIKKDGKPNLQDAPDDVKGIFNIDKIQGLITNHSSESFEVAIFYPEREDKKFVAITIPPGIKTPVATKKPLVDENNKNIVEKDCVFVRSLDSNNTPSTTSVTYKDWPKLVEKCFDNREADIGRFLRRHLANISNLPEILNFLGEKKQKEQQTIEEQTYNFIEESLTRYNEIVSERKATIPPHGAMEIAAIINGEFKKLSTNRDFLNLILSSNPDYTGWPIWVDSRSFTDTTARPYVFKGYWESFIAHFDTGWNDLDFWRISPLGRFYLRTGLQDDISGSKVQHTRLKTLDFGLVVLRVAEAIAVAIAFAKAMECDEESSVFFAFRWTALKDRILSSWANPGRHLSYERKCFQNDVISYIEIPVNVPKSALYSYAHEINKSLFELFEGFQLSESVTEDLVTRLLERKL
jgi:hypothetical protein